ncbi:MAG: 4Fe-4S dicluster domain-containing protein [archaeon]|nr:4Fe-4S dicluster domain-containing protein [Candidatus Micrarchaeota archaeon]MBU1887026.1 4Fe-4S dicluster domain-containing protein [Candidatus Micrarchaeota archaeon]
MVNRFDEMQSLLDRSKYFKLVCGAGNEDAEQVKRLTILYTLGGAKGMDVSANVNVVKACMEGIDFAFENSGKFGVKLKTRPFITVSVGMSGDHHARKAQINPEICVKCKQCIGVCPTSAIAEENALVKVNRPKCIGCGNCGAICPVKDAISFHHNVKELEKILPECMNAGAEHIELHAAVADDKSIMDEWKTVNEVNSKNHVSMCLDRLHLSDFALEERVRKAKEISGNRLIIQADGYPMSGGNDDYNTTLQAVAIADIINKRFNKKLNRQTRTMEYLTKNEVDLLLSGGTNSLTGKLARQNGVRFQGVSIGTFGRKLVKDIIKEPNFYENEELIKKGYLIAKKLVEENIGEVNE